MTALAASPPSVGAIAFRKRPIALTLYLLMGFAFTIQGLATAVFLSGASDLDPPLRAITVGVSLFLAAIGLWFAMAAWFRLRGPDEAIVVGPAGLHDRTLSRQPIPWRSIRNLHVARGARGASVLAFDISDDVRRDILFWPRISEPINRAFGYGCYIFVMGTDASVPRLAAAIARHAPVAAQEALA